MRTLPMRVAIKKNVLNKILPDYPNTNEKETRIPFGQIKPKYTIMGKREIRAKST